MADQPLLLQWLLDMVARKGSDLYISFGSPPLMRGDAGMVPLADLVLDDETLAQVFADFMTGEQLEGVADLAERLGAGEIRTTIMQNFVLTGVPAAKTQDAVRGLNDLGLTVEASNFWRGTVACTGTEFCKLAITETKGFARWLVEEMETRMPGFDQQIKLNVTGCPNNCGQAWIADVGLEGKKIKHDGKLADAWYFSLGGALGKHAGLARQVNYRCASHDVPDALERLLKTYLATRESEENLRAWFAGRSNDELRAVLASSAVALLPSQD